ncbi:DUF1295-domain-containing protein [Saccharata proteae CBS 121410]|uniref:DUF1295-domain-containing protein n=1 Tax=Saccharata proteae CBS 121410 TaxID=1314787 RepID=A0A9P4HNY2_9PEZI|nr:DUF1295-domain-containing protein [Saccharata proteae CBS 121410]
MSTAVHVLDSYYLSITLLVTIAYQLFFFSIAYTLKFDKLTDFAGGTNFVLLAILTLSLSGANTNARQILASLFIITWGARLSAFLLFRILKTGKDDRFDDKRDKFLPFLGFWIFQMLWVWTVSLPITILNAPATTSHPQPGFGTASDVAGVVLYAVGLVTESVSDAQKYRFRSSTAGRTPGSFMSTGLFAWSRHPNYFGEILLQFAIYMVCVSPAGYRLPSGAHALPGSARAALYASVVGPVFLTVLLLFVSGLPLQERPGAKKRYEKGNQWEAYRAYLERTSILWPFPPKLYRRLPVLVKRTLFLELPVYVFDPSRHAEGAKAGAAPPRS